MFFMAEYGPFIVSELIQRNRMATIDVTKLRDCPEDYYGTAAFNGFPTAIAGLLGLSNLSDYELCEYTEQHGVDLTKFSIE